MYKDIVVRFYAESSTFGEKACRTKIRIYFWIIPILLVFSVFLSEIAVDIKNTVTRIIIGITMILPVVVIFFLIYSLIVLSIRLHAITEIKQMEEVLLDNLIITALHSIQAMHHQENRLVLDGIPQYLADEIMIILNVLKVDAIRL